MAQSIISARNISKRYRLGATHHDTLRDRITYSLRSVASGGGDEKTSDEMLWALEDVSFDVDQGDVVGVVGRNGAGKSTLLKILSRITEPTSGELPVRGRLASLVEVGTGFHPELTGRENIFLNGAILGMKQSEVRNKFDAIVAFSEVEKFLDTPIKRYSSGMYVRLAFAVAAHLEPEILVVDEVLAVGDAQFQSKCLGKMGEVAREGRTVLFVSHNMAAVSALCRKGILLEGGRLTKAGPIEEIVSAYVTNTGKGAHQFTAKTRAGSGLVRVTNFEVSSTRGPNVVVCGAKMVFTISYEAEKADLPIQFVVGVFDAFNVRVLYLDSQVDSTLPPNFTRRGKVRLEFGEEFSLNPGRFSINIGARVRGELVDHIKQAMVFDVQEGNFFGNGRMASDKGTILYRNQWQFEPENI
ncbi:MAG: transporter, ATP-binding protein [Verrucomicrobiales bacterium]|nr:transporter, ATP-binding protein [Verrucomicrobiales bacterium]